MKLKIGADERNVILLVNASGAENDILFFGTRTEFDRFKPNCTEEKDDLVLFIAQLIDTNKKIRKKYIIKDFNEKAKIVQKIKCSLKGNTLFIKKKNEEEVEFVFNPIIDSGLNDYLLENFRNIVS